MHYECAITEAWKETQQVVLDVFNKILDVTKEALFPGRDGGLPGRSSWRACYGGPMDEKAAADAIQELEDLPTPTGINSVRPRK